MVAVVAVGVVLTSGVFSNQLSNQVASQKKNSSSSSRYETPPSEWHSPPKVNIGQGFGVGSADYVIFKGDQGNVYAKSGDNGGIALASDNAAYVIQEAIDRLGNENGGKIFIRDGTYHLDSTITMENGVTIKGEQAGMGVSPATKLAFDNVPGFLFPKVLGSTLQTLSIRTSEGTPEYGIKVRSGGHALEFRRLKVKDFSDAIWILNQGGSNIQNSIVGSRLLGDNYAIHFQGAADWNVMSDRTNAIIMENGTSDENVDATNDRITFINSHISPGPSIIGPKDYSIKIRETRTNNITLIGGDIEGADNEGILLTDGARPSLCIYGTSFYLGGKPKIKLVPTADAGVSPWIRLNGQGGHRYSLSAGDSPENISSPYDIPKQVAYQKQIYFGSEENAWIGLDTLAFRLYGGSRRIKISSSDNPAFSVRRGGDFKFGVWNNKTVIEDNLDMTGENIKNVSKVMIENLYDLDPQASAPTSAEAGTVAMSDGTNWDVDGDGYAELAIYNGSSWLVLENMETTY